MGAGLFIEPAVVVILLIGGTWINRNYYPDDHIVVAEKADAEHQTYSSGASIEARLLSHSQSDSEASSPIEPTSPTTDGAWRTRKLALYRWSRNVHTPSTHLFRDRLISRILRKFPFIIEVIYWGLIYWVYQLGRAFTAVTMAEGTLDVARRHAYGLIHLEQRINIFYELDFQAYFLHHPTLLLWTNRLYSFIHIPGTIAFLIWLYYQTNTCNRINTWLHRSVDRHPAGLALGSPAGPVLYEKRRRTMALCNVLAFIVFTAWPCMPPRLLNDPASQSSMITRGARYPFVDTVHGKDGEASVWTDNRFVNHFAAMPSLHFGYALLIGLTVATVPLAPAHRAGRRRVSLRRLMCVLVGVSYPISIFVAIIATANHFFLDAVAGAAVCIVGWHGNRIMLNLLPMEDWVLWCLRIHKPARRISEKSMIQEL